MKSEKLIAKKVKHYFSAAEKQVLFEVKSLEEHYDGLLIHESDIIYLGEEDSKIGYVKEGDVNMDDAVSKEVAKEEEVLGMTYEEADKLLKIGGLTALPEWKGFWFNNIKTDETLVLTKEGEITDTPWGICKERNDWQVVEATEEQDQLLRDYFEKADDIIEIEVTAETIEDNPELVSEGIVVGEIINVDASDTIEEIIQEKVVKKKSTKKQK